MIRKDCGIFQFHFRLYNHDKSNLRIYDIHLNFFHMSNSYHIMIQTLMCMSNLYAPTHCSFVLHCST